MKRHKSSSFVVNVMLIDQLGQPWHSSPLLVVKRHPSLFYMSQVMCRYIYLHYPYCGTVAASMLTGLPFSPAHQIDSVSHLDTYMFFFPLYLSNRFSQDMSSWCSHSPFEFSWDWRREKRRSSGLYQSIRHCHTRRVRRETRSSFPP